MIGVPALLDRGLFVSKYGGSVGGLYLIAGGIRVTIQISWIHFYLQATELWSLMKFFRKSRHLKTVIPHIYRSILHSKKIHLGFLCRCAMFYGSFSKVLPILIGKTNPHYQQWMRLLRSAGRKRSGLFLIEGEREALRAVSAGIPLEAMVFNQTAIASGKEKLLFNALQSASLHLEAMRAYVLSDALFRTLSVREHPDGILAVAKRIERSQETLQFKSDGLYVLTEGLEKPGNLGALLRSSEATAVDALLLADPQTDVFNPNVIRTSQGAVFQVPIYINTSEWFLEKIRASRLSLWAATPHAQRSFWECDFTHGGVFCIGNEARGLSDVWLQAATAVKIPMYGRSADSLNAAVAGTLLLYEARRQQTAKGA